MVGPVGGACRRRPDRVRRSGRSVMRYVPDGPEVDAVAHVRLGPTPYGRAAPALTLGTEPGITLPAAWRADTTAAVVLRLLRTPAGREALGGLEAVTSDAFSGDRLLAMWALTWALSIGVKERKMREPLR